MLAYLNRLESINMYDDDVDAYQTHVTYKLIISELISRFYGVLHSNLNTSCPEWLIDLCQKMKTVDNFSQGMSKLYDIAQKSPEHISRAFKRYLDVTPTQYITNLRLNYIKNLLVTSDQLIIDICYKSGFGNLSHFNHVFKKHNGISPLSYRKMHKKNVIPSSSS